MPPTLPSLVAETSVDGRRWWLYSDGSLLPVIRGGDGTDDGDDGGDKAGTDDSGDGDDDDGADELGEKGKKALASERAAAKAAVKAQRAAEKRAKDAEDRLSKLEADGKSEHEKALEKARNEAAEEARKDESTKSNMRLLRAEVKAAAGTKMANPELAPRLVDLDEFEVDDDGNVDAKAITKAIDELLKENPGLAADAKKPKGSGDGGPRPRGGATEDLTPNQRLRRAYSKTSS